MKWKWEKNNNLTVLLLFLIQFVFAIAAIVCGMWLELYMRQLFLIKIQHISGAVESYGRKIEFIQKDGFFQFSQKSSFVFSQSPPPPLFLKYTCRTATEPVHKPPLRITDWLWIISWGQSVFIDFISHLECTQPNRVHFSLQFLHKYHTTTPRIRDN